LNKRAILLVEDNPDDVELTIRAFRKNQINNPIEVANDGVEAINFLFKKDQHLVRDPLNPEIGLILLDLKLPRMDGTEVLKEIRSNEATSLIPVVVLTSSVEERDLLECYRLGANSYVRKPIDFNRSAEVLKMLASYWLEVNESPATL
jgi:two-component system response regulator